MASMIPAAAGMISSGASNNMQNGQGPLQAYADPANIFGGNSAQAMDPIGYGIFNALGIKDPLTTLTNKIPGFHGTDPNANGIPNVLPNLGAASMIPQMPQGAFQHFTGGPGIYNQMAAQSMGGRMFNPGAMPMNPQTPQSPQSPGVGGKGGNGFNLGNLQNRFGGNIGGSFGGGYAIPQMVRTPDKVRY